MKRIIVFLMTLIVLSLPLIVNAQVTDDDIKEMLSQVPGLNAVEHDPGYTGLPEYDYHSNVDLNNIKENSLFDASSLDRYCTTVNTCFLNVGNDWYSYKDADKDLMLASENENVLYSVFHMFWIENLYDGFYQISNNYNPVIVIDDYTNNVIKIRFTKYDNNNQVFFDYLVNYVYDDSNVDSELKAKANEVINNLDTIYETKDLDYINALFNYGTTSDILNESDAITAIYQFRDLKRDVEKNNTFNYHFYLDGGLGDFDFENLGGFIVLEKDGIEYAARRFNLLYSHTIYVDKDEEGTRIEKATKRIKEYIKDSRNFTITCNSNFYGMENKYIDGVLYPLDICNIQVEGLDVQFDISLPIVEVPASYIKQLEVHALNYDTGIEIDTSGYEVPVDVILSVDDLKNAENIKSILAKYNYEMIDAYNINLIGRRGNSQVKTIQDGVTVFIPIKGYSAGDKITVRHINDDGSIGETLEATVVERNGKLYAKFITTHFSTYALVSDIETVSNPPTIDNIIVYIVMFIISFVSLVELLYVYKKSC